MQDPTLVIHWIFSCLALLVMGVRLVWKQLGRQSFNLGDYLTMAACFCCLVRLALIHVVLTWGTNNIPAALRQTKVFTETELYQRTVGSKFAVANRVFYNSLLWLQKLVLLDVYRRLLLNLRFEKPIMVSFLVVFFITYVAIQVTTFVECRPLHLYWQVVPDPGSCAKAQLQLIVVGVLNIVTDVMLLAVPVPLFFSLNTSWKSKLRLYTLFTLGIFIVAVTVIRLPINSMNKDSQVSRTTWASTELLTATIVVNAPTLYGLWNKRKQTTGYSHSHGSRMPDHHSRKSRAAGGTLDDHGATPPSGNILQTQEFTMDEHIELKDESSNSRVRVREAETSSSSSQRGILRDGP